MFRVAELRKRHVIGAKVRVYCVRHERCPVATGGGVVGELETAYFVSHPLSLLNGPPSLSGVGNSDVEPKANFTYEQNILMGLPHVVVHRIDSLSPLLPPRPIWYDEGGIPHGPFVGNSTTLSGSTTSAARDVAPTSFQIEEGQIISSEEITSFLHDRQAEIIVLLEGTCEVTGMALQARQSYRLEDIAFHQTFSPCVFPVGPNEPTRQGKWWNPFAIKCARVDQDVNSCGGRGEEGNSFRKTLAIDFSQYHELLPAPHDSLSCPYIPTTFLSDEAQ